DAWRWEDEKAGIRIVGARSCGWDTAFAMRALLSVPGTPEVVVAPCRGYRWLAGAQEGGELPPSLQQGRDSVTGGWCFSDGAHRWPVSDCTAEALSAVLAVHRRAELQSVIGPRIPQRGSARQPISSCPGRTRTADSAPTSGPAG